MLNTSSRFRDRLAHKPPIKHILDRFQEVYCNQYTKAAREQCITNARSYISRIYRCTRNSSFAIAHPLTTSRIVCDNDKLYVFIQALCSYRICARRGGPDAHLRTDRASSGGGRIVLGTISSDRSRENTHTHTDESTRVFWRYALPRDTTPQNTHRATAAYNCW